VCCARDRLLAANPEELRPILLGLAGQLTTTQVRSRRRARAREAVASWPEAQTGDTPDRALPLLLADLLEIVAPGLGKHCLALLGSDSATDEPACSPQAKRQRTARLARRAQEFTGIKMRPCGAKSPRKVAKGKPPSGSAPEGPVQV
jgi:hypothetical protein